MKNSSFLKAPVTKPGWRSVWLEVVFIVMFVVNIAVMSLVANETTWHQTILPFYAIIMLYAGWLALKLTADQKTKLTALFEDQAKKMQAMTPEDRRAKGREMREEYDKKMKASLTTEQWEKWEKARQDLRKKAEERKGGKKKDA